MSRLPLFLGALPWLARVLNIGCQSVALTSLRPLAEALSIAFFVAPLLFSIGSGRYGGTLFAGDPRLFGSAWAADAVYALSSSLVLFLIGKLFVTLFRLRR